MAKRTKPQPRKPGRPKLANGVAKGTIVPVRFSDADYQRIYTAAATEGKTVSEWIRSTLSAAIG